MRNWFCLCLIASLLAPGWGAEERSAFRFDFGPAVAQPIVAPGFQHLPPQTPYTPERGFGWMGKVVFEARDRGEPDGLRRDFIYTRHPGPLEFCLDLPNGWYEVWLVTGDTQARDHFLTLAAEGKPIVRSLNPGRREFIEVTFGVEVGDGQLTLTFTSPERNWVLNALTVTPKDQRDLPAEPVVKKVRVPDPVEEWRRKLLRPQEEVELLKVVKPADFEAPDYPWLDDYLRVLERFPLYAERGWHQADDPQFFPPDTPAEERALYRGLGWFGDVSHTEMGMRAMGNFIFVYALLATDPNYDPAPSGVSRETVRQHALQCLRYMCRTHVTGDLYRPGRRRWGNHWQSAWWASRMVTGAQLLRKELSAADRELVRRVVIYEADRHLERTPPGGVARDTKSEENAWDCEILAWAVALYPDHPHAPRWEEKLRQFAFNTLSVPQDAADDTEIDGRAIQDWVTTVNVHPDFTIENHGAYHFCYLACPLHSLTWSYWALHSLNRPVPLALYHHYRDVFEVIRRTFLYTSRFAYLGGKDWPRYLYGLYFILPALVHLQNEFGEADARLFERLRFRTFEREQLIHRDGTFFGGRFTRNIMGDRPAEYETDCYAMLALCYLLHQDKPVPLKPTPVEEYQQRVRGTWASEPNEFVVSRSPRAFISFSWRMLRSGHAFGLFVPAKGEDLVEWGEDQFVGRFAVAGYDMRRRKFTHREQTWAEGFTTTGHIAEGSRNGEPAIDHYLSFTALPEEGLAVLFDLALAQADLTVTREEGLMLYLANDLFNDNRRLVYSGRGRVELTGVEEGGEERRHDLDTNWLNVDNLLGLVYLPPLKGQARPAANPTFTLRDFPQRNAPWRSLLTERIDCPYQDTPRSYRAGEVIRDLAFVFLAGDAGATGELAALCRRLPTGDEQFVKLAYVVGSERAYFVAANFTSEEVVLSATPPAQPEAKPRRLTVPPATTIVQAAERPPD